MQITFLASAKPDLRWFKHYYMRVFPAGRTKADKQYRAILILLRDQPRIGHSAEKFPDALEYAIPGIPFTVLYRINCDTVEIMRLYDQCSEFSNQM